MENKVSVRADHLENGKVIPISLTTEFNTVWRIDSILAIQNCDKEIQYSCRVKDKIMKLIKRGDTWYMVSDDAIK